MSDMQPPARGPRCVPWARVLLLAPFVAVLWVPSYDSVDPAIAGVPFFYWYQLAWVAISAIIIAVVYLVER